MTAEQWKQEMDHQLQAVGPLVMSAWQEVCILSSLVEVFTIADDRNDGYSIILIGAPF